MIIFNKTNDKHTYLDLLLQFITHTPSTVLPIYKQTAA